MSYAQPASSGRRLTGLVVTVALHVALVYALVHGLARKIVEVVLPPLETKIIEEARPPAPDRPPPPPPPKLAPPPPPFVPLPEVRIQMPVQAAPAITVTPAPPPPAPVVIAPAPPPPAPAPPPPVRLVNGPERIQDSCERPPYQASWRRAGEAGAVQVRVLVETNGRVSDARIEKSSGFRRLDEAAREAALECRYRPGMGSDGKPMKVYQIIVYTWRLTD
jgi:protein TonB